MDVSDELINLFSLKQQREEAHSYTLHFLFDKFRDALMQP